MLRKISLGDFHIWLLVQTRSRLEEPGSVAKRKRKRGFVAAYLEGFQVMMAFPSTVVRKHQHVKTLQKTPV